MWLNANQSSKFVFEIPKFFRWNSNLNYREHGHNNGTEVQSTVAEL